MAREPGMIPKPTERTLLIIGVTCGVLVVLAARIIAARGIFPKQSAANEDSTRAFIANIVGDARAAFHK